MAAPARKAVALAGFTIAYNVIEGMISVGAGLAADSVSLIGFGADSAIEVLAAGVVLTRLLSELRDRPIDEGKERMALRIIAGTFFALAAYVVIEGVQNLVAAEKPATSTVGIVLTGVSVVVMPLLARTKRNVGETLGSRLVVADAAETRLCAWLSASTFLGLGGYALVGWTWIDPVAGFVIAHFAVREGREAWDGD